ncbi:MAG: hypothetical protein MK135_14145 [Polyangiaceae bacterium]|nr:hypothetical protein [Polyangiaceae bacterium]
MSAAEDLSVEEGHGLSSCAFDLPANDNATPPTSRAGLRPSRREGGARLAQLEERARRGGGLPQLYAYVSGAVLKNVDPLGLEDEAGDQARATIEQGEVELAQLQEEHTALQEEHAALSSISTSTTEQEDEKREAQLTALEGKILQNEQRTAEVGAQVDASRKFLRDPPVLGIHSQVAGDGHEFMIGHAWISVKDEDGTRTIGLWPDWADKVHARGDQNPFESDVRHGYEDDTEAEASRYFSITESEKERLEALIAVDEGWLETNNCSSWASETVEEVVGVDVDADDWMGFETPRELGGNIQSLEAADPSSPERPTTRR